MAEKWHSGITMHKLPVASGFIGAVFTVGCALIFLLGLPQLWYFIAFSAALGVGIAILLRILNNRRSDRLKPLSILQADEKETCAVALQQDKSWNLFHAKPVFSAP